MSDSQPGKIDYETQDKVAQKSDSKGRKGLLLLLPLFYLCCYLGLYTLFGIIYTLFRLIIGSPVSLDLITGSGSGFWFGMLFAAAATISMLIWHQSVKSRIFALFEKYAAMPLALVGAIILSGNLAAHLWDAFLWLIYFAMRYGLFLPVYVMFIIGVIAVSVLAFFLRSRNRIVYGLIEMLVGMVGVVYSVSSIILEPYLKGTLASLLDGVSSYLILQLLTAMYIIVRGLTNIEDGFGKGKLTFLTFLLESAFRLGNFRRSHLPTRLRRHSPGRH